MSKPHIHPKRRTFSASKAIDVQAKVLREIRSDEDLTFAELGKYLGGKSSDRARAYTCEEVPSAIDMLTFLTGCEVWEGKFADPILALVGLRTAPLGAVCNTDERGSICLARLLPEIIDIEADGLEEASELKPHEALIRKVHAITGRWIETIAREPGLKVVGE